MKRRERERAVQRKGQVEGDVAGRDGAGRGVLLRQRRRRVGVESVAERADRRDRGSRQDGRGREEGSCRAWMKRWSVQLLGCEQGRTRSSRTELVGRVVEPLDGLRTEEPDISLSL